MLPGLRPPRQTPDAAARRRMAQKQAKWLFLQDRDVNESEFLRRSKTRERRDGPPLRPPPPVMGLLPIVEGPPYTPAVSWGLRLYRGPQAGGAACAAMSKHAQVVVAPHLPS